MDTALIMRKICAPHFKTKKETWNNWTQVNLVQETYSIQYI